MSVPRKFALVQSAFARQSEAALRLAQALCARHQRGQARAAWKSHHSLQKNTLPLIFISHVEAKRDIPLQTDKRLPPGRFLLASLVEMT